jgi:hypothetical protein
VRQATLQALSRHLDGIGAGATRAIHACLAPGATLVSHNAGKLELYEPAFWKATHEDLNLETNVTRCRGGRHPGEHEEEVAVAVVRDWQG